MAPQVMAESFPYDGVQLTISEYEFSSCPACGEEFVLPEQARRNERRFADAKRAHDGLLTSEQIVAWRNRWGLSQQQAAALLGGGVNAFSKYERGEVMQSQAMDLLIRTSDRFGSVREFLGERAGIEFLGEHWEPTADASSDIVVPARRLPDSEKSRVVDIMAYRIREACGSTAHNDGEWRSEPGYSYGP